MNHSTRCMRPWYAIPHTKTLLQLYLNRKSAEIHREVDCVRMIFTAPQPRPEIKYHNFCFATVKKRKQTKSCTNCTIKAIGSSRNALLFHLPNQIKQRKTNPYETVHIFMFHDNLYTNCKKKMLKQFSPFIAQVAKPRRKNRPLNMKHCSVESPSKHTLELKVPSVCSANM